MSQSKPNSKKLRRVLILLLLLIPLLGMVAVVALFYVFLPYQVVTHSMEPTIPAGSYVVACRLPFLGRPVGKNDIVVFEPVEGVSPAPWIHRIVADSGESVTPPEREGRVDISSEGRARHRKKSSGPLVVPESFLYQSGDSVSSSYHGLVPHEKVIAKVIFHFELP